MAEAEHRDGEVRGAVARAHPPLFAGRYAGKIDAKGRVILPAPFRQKLSGEVYVFPSLTEPVVQIGDEALHDLVLRAVKGLEAVDSLDRRLTALENYVLHRLQAVGVDDAGRVILPADLRAHGRLDGALAFAGRGQHFILASAAYLDQHDAEAEALGAEFTETLAALMRPTLRGGGA